MMVNRQYKFSPWLAMATLLLVIGDGYVLRGANPTLERMTIDVKPTGPVIAPELFSVNLEHTRYAMWKGLCAELLANRKFAGGNVADDWKGTTWRRGIPGPDGVVARWHAVGDSATHFSPDLNEFFAGKQSQRIQIANSGSKGGIGQDKIPLQANTTYTARFQVKAQSPLTVTVQLTDATGSHTYVTRKLYTQQHGWQEWSFTFTAPVTDLKSRLEIGFQGPGTLWLGSASLLPVDHFHGMRHDVIECLKQIAPPMVRWPGGNFTRTYRWKEGLLEIDRRPPIQSAWGAVLALTDHYDFHEVGIDEYMALCRELDCEPCITLWMGPGGVQEAADWVEYCNGNANTKWGAIRAQRGQHDPYRVKYWMIGNEIYGEWMSRTPFQASDYAAAVREYSAAIKAVDSTLIVIAVGLDVPWNQTVISDAGDSFDILGLPHYSPITKALTGTDGASEFTRQALQARQSILPWLEGERQGMDELGTVGQRIQLMLAEWNIKHDWFNYPFVNQWHVSPIDAAFAASQLNMLCRSANSLNMKLAAMFQPVNEGAIAVKPFSAELTAMGQVLALYRAHRGGRLLEIDSSHDNQQDKTPGSSDPTSTIDGCSSISANGKQLFVTLVNTAATPDQPVEIVLRGAQPGRATANILTVGQLRPDVAMDEVTKTIAVDDGQKLNLSVPRFGIVLLQIDLQD